MDRIARRLGVVRTALRADDLERLYGDDHPPVEVIERVASSEIPPGTDAVLRTPLSKLEGNLDELDVLEQDLVRVFLLVERLVGVELRHAVLLERVDELIARTDAQRAGTNETLASVVEESSERAGEADATPGMGNNRN